MVDSGEALFSLSGILPEMASWVLALTDSV